MKKFLLSILGLAMVVATNAQTATTTTTKTIPATDTIDVSGMVADIQVVYGEFAVPRVEQDITITHPNAGNVLPAMFNAGRYNIETRGNKVAHTHRVNMPVTAGGIDVEQKIRVRLYVSRETIIIQ